mmetsp:Transcript_86155/g.224630  ORF Transcript_86155/g.224630 Transcript_86155/m.224630 type:complete len:204 (-) Transcript_86155:70-681(-)
MTRGNSEHRDFVAFSCLLNRCRVPSEKGAPCNELGPDPPVASCLKQTGIFACVFRCFCRRFCNMVHAQPQPLSLECMFKMSSCTDLHSTVGRDVAEAQPQTTRLCCMRCTAWLAYATPFSIGRGAPRLEFGDLFARTRSFACAVQNGWSRSERRSPTHALRFPAWLVAKWSRLSHKQFFLSMGCVAWSVPNSRGWGTDCSVVL